MIYRNNGNQNSLNEYGQAAVFFPQSLAYTGVLPLTSASFWTSSLGKWLANKRHPITLAFRKPKPCSGRKLARKWRHAIARGWATLLLDRLRDFVVAPSSAGGNSSFELHSQSTEHGGACQFGPLPSLPWPLGRVRLISFLGLVCAALLFFSACWPSNSGPSAFEENNKMKFKPAAPVSRGSCGAAAMVYVGGRVVTCSFVCVYQYSIST